MGDLRNFLSCGAWKVASVERRRGTAQMAKRRERVVLPRAGRQDHGHTRYHRCQLRCGKPGGALPSKSPRNGRHVRTVLLRCKQRRSALLDQHATEIGVDANVRSDGLDCQPDQIERSRTPKQEYSTSEIMPYTLTNW